MIGRLRLFFSSIGRFCNGAFLTPLYGCGDLAPGFCRASAVKGSIFALNWCPAGYVVQNLKYHNAYNKKGHLFLFKSQLTSEKDIGIYCVTEADLDKNECKYVNLLLSSETTENECQNERITFSKLEDKEITVPVIGSEFETGGSRFSIMDVCDINGSSHYAKCRLVTKLTGGTKAALATKAISSNISLDLSQLRFVKWKSFGTSVFDRNKEKENEKEKKEEKDENRDNVTRFTGVISNSKQFIRGKNLVSSVDYFNEMINQVSIRHYRMTVVTDGALKGCFQSETDDDKDDDSDSDSDESDTESDDDDDSGKKKKEKKKDSSKDKKNNSNEKKSGNDNLNCVVHIPPNTKPFNNPYSIHIIQLDHTSCSVPKPLILTYFWTRADINESKNASESRASLERCLNTFYRENLFDNEKNNKPLLMFSSIYEQKLRDVEIKGLPSNVFIVKDLSDTLGYHVACQRVEF